MGDTHMPVRPKLAHAIESCAPVLETLARVGDKWTVMVVGVLSHGPLRYNELHREITGISQRMLTLTLKSLEFDGLVLRTVTPTNPPRVDYALTELGLTLIKPLETLHEWSLKHRDDIAAARKAHAKATKK